MGKTLRACIRAMIVALLMIGAPMIFAIDPVFGLQDADYTFEISGDYATITGYTGHGGEITIPSTLGGHPVQAIGIRAFSNIDSIVSVIIPDGVTTIWDSAFEYCSSLTSVMIPGSVSLIVTPFIDCTSLITIDVAKSNQYYASEDGVLYDKGIDALLQYPPGRSGGFSIPSNVSTIGTLAFYDCYGLTSVEMPDKLTDIGYGAFWNCGNLNTAEIPSSVITIGTRAFTDCFALAGVNIPENVSSIGDYAFSFCTNLTSIGVSLDNQYYSSIDGVLYDKPASKLIQCPSGKEGGFIVPDTVTQIGNGAFYCCAALNAITIPGGVSSIGEEAFWGCSVTSLAISESVTSIGARAFSSCLSLTSLTFFGLVAPITIGEDWLSFTPEEIRGHAYVASNFPAPGYEFYGLVMGEVIDPTIPAAPINPSATPGYEQIILAWTAPSFSGGSLITNYKIYRGTASGGETYLTTIGNIRTFTDTNLVSNQTYYYRVSAVNSVGEGELSSEFSAAPYGISAPQGLLYFTGDGLVTLTWSAPSQTGGAAIIGYRIYRGMTPGGEALLVTVGNVLTFSDSSVTNDQTYYYRVSAISSTAEGELTYEVSARPTGASNVVDDLWVSIGIGLVAGLAVACVAALLLRRKGSY
jgi:hypothetical protein